MLTIKIIEKDGTEFVTETNRVANMKETDALDGRPGIVYWLPSGDRINIYEGDVYVMNDFGKTIADYHLHVIG